MLGGNRDKELEKQVLEALRKVQDPELHRSIVDIGMVKNLVVRNAEVSFEIVLTTTACPLKAQIQKEAEGAASSVEGVKKVQAKISGETLQAKIPQKQPIPGIKNVIAVSSGKGGVGKTTVAVNLACALQKRGASVGILDADIYGPNVPLMMGLKEAIIHQQTADGKMKPPENHNIKVMSMAFLTKDEQPVAWRGPLLDQVIRQFFMKTGWDALDYLIVDLPPGTGDAQLTVIDAAPLAGAIIVTTPQDVAILDSKKGLRMFQSANVPVLGVIENMSYHVCAHCGEKEALFGEGGGSRLAELLDVPFLGAVPMNSDVRRYADEGVPIVIAKPESAQAQAFLDIAHRLTTAICERGVDELLAVAPA